MITLSGLRIYPIKSCGGVGLERARVTRRGLFADRRYMIVDERGRFMTQRTRPGLRAVRLELLGAHAAAGEPEALRASADGLPPLELPAVPSEGTRVDIEVWKHYGPAVRHDAGSAWFTNFLGEPVQLVGMPDSIERPVKPLYSQPGDVVSFADGYPFLLCSEASLADLNQRSNLTLVMARFRPNLVVRGAMPFAEDEWARLRIGAIPFRGAKPCARCVMTTIDPDTGAGGKEPLRTLASFRARPGGVYFGMNLIGDGEGELRVGNELEVIEQRPVPFKLD